MLNQAELQHKLEKFRKLQDLERFKHLFGYDMVEIAIPCPLCTWEVPEYIKKIIIKAFEAEIEKLQ